MGTAFFSLYVTEGNFRPFIIRLAKPPMPATKNSSEIELSPIDFSSMGWMAVPTAADVQVAMLLMAAVTPK